jgi:hypothetical protein
VDGICRIFFLKSSGFGLQLHRESEACCCFGLTSKESVQIFLEPNPWKPYHHDPWWRVSQGTEMVQNAVRSARFVFIILLLQRYQNYCTFLDSHSSGQRNSYWFGGAESCMASGGKVEYLNIRRGRGGMAVPVSDLDDS